jgi:Ni/Co efflux regulator RcnB
MRKLALLALAAGALILPTTASAQMVVQQRGGANFHGGNNFHGGFRGGSHGGMFPHRLQRGFIVPPVFFGQQFYVDNWQLYGFAPPPRNHRWVRYYDDAYLIDGGGRIVDTRYGLDWDRYGERWNMVDGIPSYYGRGDFRPDERDYAWVEGYRRDHGDDWDYADMGPGYGPGPGPGPGPDFGPPPGYGPPPGPQGCGMPQPCGGYMPAYGYGYGWGVVYPMVIETTTVTSGCGCGYEVVTEEVVEVRNRVRHRPRPRPHRAPPPPPPPGERG